MSEYQDKDRLASVRRRMLEEHLEGRDITDPRVLKVMAEVPRDEFVSRSYISQAYSDGPLPIGLGQTISQPYIVALMTQELHVDGGCEVLEIGTGSGYQTAVLSKLAKRVYTIERHGGLSESAQAVLGRLGIGNVEFYIGDGSCGWPDERLFERIMVTAAVPAIPQKLFDQLAGGGIIIAPVGLGGVQRLVACEKRPGKTIERFICDVRFVKLFGEYGFEQ
ncbi:MAG: protein-L-isoaspartate(D-aspartate) O-methyltransferase [Sedimentisphaerales bacterium]|nr:protein-L-isoaspartate(D-aspartate) O-methyltransferase [Sedimentisphaerales bacterium]